MSEQPEADSPGIRSLVRAWVQQCEAIEQHVRTCPNHGDPNRKPGALFAMTKWLATSLDALPVLRPGPFENTAAVDIVLALRNAASAYDDDEGSQRMICGMAVMIDLAAAHGLGSAERRDDAPRPSWKFTPADPDAPLAIVVWTCGCWCDATDAEFIAERDTTPCVPGERVLH